MNCSGFISHSAEQRCSLLLPSDNSFVNIGTIEGDVFLLSGTYMHIEISFGSEWVKWKKNVVVCKMQICQLHFNLPMPPKLNLRIYLSTDFFGTRQIIFGNNMNTIEMFCNS